MLMKATRYWVRQATWLLPGLLIKRWITMAVLGLFLLLLGMALFMNLQPITLTIDTIKALAPYMPSSVSGPIFIGLGLFLIYLGFTRTYGTMYQAMGPAHSDSDILEALYRRNKLAHGPIIVAIGGGTGLSTLLRGIKRYTNNITAVVTVGDDGGSSGRLREEWGIIPPGDIRNCIAALADEEQLITELFQYRFKTGSGLEGHSFGNLFLTAMCRITGDMFSAIKESSKVLNIRGRVLPSTLDNLSLVAELEDGRIIHGESNIPEAHGKIARLTCEPACPEALPDVIKAIQQAELIILGPGSLYTSVVPNLLIDAIAKAVSESRAPKAYVSNVMTQPGETDGYTVGDHVKAILDHAKYPNVLDVVFVNNGLPDSLVEKYAKSGYHPVITDVERCREMGVQVVQLPMIDDTESKTIRHNPGQLARAIIHWFKREYPRRLKNADHMPVINIAAEEIADPANSQHVAKATR